MIPSRSSHKDALTSAIDDVFGPGRAAAASAFIVTAGLAGWSAGSRNADCPAWLGPWACAGYGIALGGLLTLLPRLLKAANLNAALVRRPAPEAPVATDRPWWPLRLLTAALRHTPVLRMTAQDFTSATTSLVNEARGLLAQRLWPACAAGFTAPVLGLVGAWLAWGHAMSAVERQATVAAVPLLVVASPMALTILAGLAVMLAVVIVDQTTRGLLQRWSTTLRFDDATAPVVREGLEAAVEVPRTGVRPDSDVIVDDHPEPGDPSPPVQASPRVEQPAARTLTAGDLSELGKLFQDR